MKKHFSTKKQKGLYLFFAICWLLFPVCCDAAGEIKDATAIDTQETNQTIPKELDLGDYQTEMLVGEKQLLTVTILPIGAAGGELAYNSSQPQVAEINGMGRITAKSEGKTKITVSCGNVKNSFSLTVKKEENTDIPVTELDLGECPRELTAGTSQLITVAVIPQNATTQEFTYTSDNPAVAEVNALGRVSAKQTGTATITVACGGVKGSFVLTVIPEEKTAVTDIEIGEHEKELNVDSTMNLSVTVLPATATDTTVTYVSSNPEIATVNSSGEVKAIATGNVTITITAGNITKQVELTVKIATTAIELNSDYQIMKPGDTFQITAKIIPQGASGTIHYKSLNTEVAQVNASGLITAKSCGDTAVVVSNSDMQVSVTVIVNEEADKIENEKAEKDVQGEKPEYPDEVSTEEYPVITGEMLKYFYENKKVLTIRGRHYTIYVDGNQIVNYENELYTMLDLKKKENGFTMEVNQGKKLCGGITIDISQRIQDEKYLYLYNQEKQKYQKIAAEDITVLTITTPGTYLFTEKQIGNLQINLILVGVGFLIILAGIGIYIGVKKQYWFW